MGSIAAEKRADLVLLAAEPLADIHATTNIQGVWLNGQFFDRSALDQLLVAAKHRQGTGKLNERELG
jgi:hypothetical protein